MTDTPECHCWPAHEHGRTCPLRRFIETRWQGGVGQYMPCGDCGRTDRLCAECRRKIDACVKRVQFRGR